MVSVSALRAFSGLILAGIAFHVAGSAAQSFLVKFIGSAVASRSVNEVVADGVDELTVLVVAILPGHES